MKKYSLFLIHNHNRERIENQLLVGELCANVFAIDTFSKFEIFWQFPQLVFRKSFPDLFRLIFVQYYSSVKLANQRFYIQNKRLVVFRKQFSLFFSTLSFTFKIMSSPKSRKNHSRKFTVEGILVDKHICAWTILANSENDYAVILEDDVFIRGNRELEDVSKHLKFLEYFKEYYQNFDFVDLAGGYKFNSDEISRLPIDNQKTADGVSFEGIWSNTTCAYIISRNAARELVGMLQINPNLRNLGVGLVLNSVNLNETRLTSFWPETLPFDHGTFSGKFVSSIFDRSKEI